MLLAAVGTRSGYAGQPSLTRPRIAPGAIGADAGPIRRGD
jgi:hypothetical protein